MSFDAAGLRSLLSTSAKLQSLMGAANPTAALAKIHYIGLQKIDLPTLGIPPYVLLEPQSYRRTAEGVGAFDASGNIELVMFLPRRTGMTAPVWSTEGAAVWADIVTITNEIVAVAHTTLSPLQISSIEWSRLELTTFNHAPAQDFWEARATVAWPF